MDDSEPSCEARARHFAGGHTIEEAKRSENCNPGGYAILTTTSAAAEVGGLTICLDRQDL